MNKAVIYNLSPHKFRDIKSGKSTILFNNYSSDKGTKVYLRETRGKRKLCPQCEGSCEVHVLMPNGYDERACYECELGYIYEGTGQVVAEFTVGS